MTTPSIDLNADVGEHDGAPPAPERALLRLVTSVNVACGWHAGDASSMRHTVVAAAACGVQVGAHPSFPDREGFGRRMRAMPPHEIVDAVAHQVDALCAVAALEDVRVRFVKPHGALYNVAWHDPSLASAIVGGVLSVDATLAIVAPHRSALAAAAQAAGVRVVEEGFLDRAYEDNGRLTPREIAGAVLTDASAAARRAADWVLTGRVGARSGSVLTVPVQTLCVHSDTPGAVALASAVRAALALAGIDVRSPLGP
ncbi:MAG: LamB/YcsF family protein [Acidobacteria bacterium]|nr:LamB/YcsF family protein [Acidobacteriota bacterium]